MRRSFTLALTGLALALAGAGPAQAQTGAQDSATGSGYRVLAPQSPDPSVATTFSFDARSGPEGEDPLGSVSLSTSGLGPSAPVHSGPVTCLRVIGNLAIIGWARTTYVRGMPIPGQENVGAVAYAQDNGTPGADLDRLQVERDYSPTPPAVCPDQFPPSNPCPVGSPGEFDDLCNISSGEIAVHDAQPASLPTSIWDCLNGGWREFGFGRLRACIRFVIWTRVCELLERHGHQPGFCPPTPPLGASRD